MENQRNNGEEQKAYTPGSKTNDQGNTQGRDPAQNLKWDQAQRRQQAGPRSYNENLESQNKSNQNTAADNEQIDQDREDPNDPKKIGDQISERQQTIDEKGAPRDQQTKRE